MKSDAHVNRPRPPRRALGVAAVTLLSLLIGVGANAQDHVAAITKRLQASGLSVADLSTTYTPQFTVAEMQIIGLREVVLETLANNLNIEISRLDRGISADEINVSLGIYDPLLAMQAVRTRTDVQNSNTPVNLGNFTLSNETQINNDRFQSSLSQLTPLGSVFTLGYADSNTNEMDPRGDTIVNPFYEQQVGLSAVQPLLRNFGPTVTNAQIRISRHQEEISRYGVLSQIDNQVAQAMVNYWDLVFSIENLSVQELFLKQALELLRVNTIKYQTGVLAQTDVLQAKAQVALGEQQVIVARLLIGTTMDQLKRIMNPTRELADWDTPIIPEDIPQPFTYPVDEPEAISEALANRPEILQTREAIKIAEINRAVSKWQRLPQLDFFGEYTINGAGDQNHRAASTISDNDYNSYQAGLLFSYPLLNRKARYLYHQSLKSLEKAGLQLQNLESDVTVEVRNAVRNLVTGYQAVAATKSTVESEQSKLDAQLKRFDVGMATSFEVLTFQQDLSTARVNYLRALVAYNKAAIDLERVCARLRDMRLPAMGIPVEEYTDKAVGSPENPIKMPASQSTSETPEPATVEKSQGK